MNITLDKHYYARLDSKLLGYMGETESRTIKVQGYQIDGADMYIMRFSYADGAQYDVDVTDGTYTVQGSLLRMVGEVKCQVLAVKVTDGLQEYVKKSQIFALNIDSSVGGDPPVPTYEDTVEALEKVMEAELKADECIDSAAAAKTSEDNAAASAEQAATSAQSAAENAAKTAQDSKSTAADRQAVEQAATETLSARDTAVSSANTATEKAQIAVDSAATASEAANTAVSARDTAVEKAGEIAESAEQISENTANIDELKSDLTENKKAIAELNDRKITKFYANSLGETTLSDSDNGNVTDMLIFGKSLQDGTPTPDNPVEIQSVVNPTVTMLGKNIGNPYEIYAKSNCEIAIIDGHIKGNTSSGFGQIAIILEKPEAKQLTISVKGGNEAVTNSLRVYQGTASTAEKLVASKNSVNYGTKLDATFTPNGTDDYSIWFRPDAAIDFDFYDFQIEYGAVATDYEPYKTKQTASLQYTLNAIPVSSGGNVTIDGQEYVADYVDVENKKLVRMVDSSKFDTTVSIVDNTDLLLNSPTEIPLTDEELATFKSLATYYPTTNVTVTSDQLNGYTTFNYPISLANGWNYVKEQLGDTRDYIYDMDLQSAEAYVNSEYAVALAELEV